MFVVFFLTPSVHFRSERCRFSIGSSEIALKTSHAFFLLSDERHLSTSVFVSHIWQPYETTGSMSESNSFKMAIFAMDERSIVFFNEK